MTTLPWRSAATPSRPSSGLRRAPAALAVLVLLAAVQWPLPATANEPDVTWSDLQTTLGNCAGTSANPTTVTLTNNLPEPDATLTVDCVAVLDLAGVDLKVRSVVIGTGQQLTITSGGSADSGTLTANADGHSYVAGIRTAGATLVVESGTVNATGGLHAAGIGGILGVAGGAGGTVVIAGGIVTASAGQHGAGIGGGQGGAGGMVEITAGRVTATGFQHGAGIGGALGGAGGDVAISGGTVIARAHGNAAGIGGSENSAGGTVEISGGTVTAVGDEFAAGIGGGNQGDGGIVEITAGTVDARGASNAAGIGGGSTGAGGDVTIADGADVTARGGYTAIGAGASGSPFGSLSVSGTLRLPTGSLHIPAGIVVPVTGQILGGAQPTIGAVLQGAGSVDNQGIVALRTANVTTTVSGRHYLVAFDAAGGSPTPAPVTVFASSLENGHRTFPTAPTRDGYEFGGWTTQTEGVGTPFTTASALSGISDGTPVAITVVADWIPVADVTTSTLTADPTSITANGITTSTITVQLKDAQGHDLTTEDDRVTLQTNAGELSSVTHVGAGTYTATLTSATTAGTATIAGALGPDTDLVPLFAHATVEFIAVPTPRTPRTPEEPAPESPPADQDRPDGGFQDVDPGSVHTEAIDRIVRYGITAGTSETTFDPSGELERRQMSTFLVRLLMLTDQNLEPPADHDAAMALLVDRGLLVGHADGDLDGDGPLTRGQAASLLARSVEEVTGEALVAGDRGFADVPRTNAHAANIDKLVGSGVIHGYVDDTFRSGAELRREQMASLISRTIELLIASGHIEELDG